MDQHMICITKARSLVETNTKSLNQDTFQWKLNFMFLHHAQTAYVDFWVDSERDITVHAWYSHSGGTLDFIYIEGAASFTS